MASFPGTFGRYPATRLRRNRRYEWSRRLMAENILTPDDLIWTVFVRPGHDETEPIPSMPGVDRMSPDVLAERAREAYSLGIPALAVFPQTQAERKTPNGDEALNPDNLVCQAVRAVKDAVPEMGVVCDVALDPYTSHGQDGLVRDGYVVNDETVETLCRQALNQVAAGCAVIAPSDMMDGRIGLLRKALDDDGHEEVRRHERGLGRHSTKADRQVVPRQEHAVVGRAHQRRFGGGGGADQQRNFDEAGRRARRIERHP